MSQFASKVAQGATVQLPLGQLAVVGLGFFCVTNPDKFFMTLAKGAQFFNGLPVNGQQQLQQHHQQPIVIHHTAPATIVSGRGRAVAFVVQLVVGAGFCWGSYMVLISVLPEAAKGMLPVNKSHFNKAVTGLGKAVINLKDSVMEQILILSGKQDELGDQQKKTHTEVVDIRDNVHDMRGDLGTMQDALDLCQASLTESERRTSYIARGVQLLTRGVSTILPEDEHLMNELVRFNMAGDEFHNKATPLQQRQRQKRLSELQRTVSAPSPGNNADHNCDSVMTNSTASMNSSMMTTSPQQLNFGSPSAATARRASYSSASASLASFSSEQQQQQQSERNNGHAAIAAVEDDVNAIMSELGCKVISQ